MKLIIIAIAIAITFITVTSITITYSYFLVPFQLLITFTTTICCPYLRSLLPLLGGHTSEGSEPAMGLSVNGIAHPDKVFHKGLRGCRIKNEGKREGKEKEDNKSLLGLTSNESNGDNDDNSNNNSIDSKSNIEEINRNVISNGNKTDEGNLGYVLVLTKGLGTGTIMAAHMRAKVLITIR